MQTASNPLSIEDISAKNSEVKRGSSIPRRVIVKNLGEQPAKVDIWISPTDKQSEPLLWWCKFSEQNPLELEAKEGREVRLNFDVPQQATPGVYNYEIVIEAPAQYPGKLISRPQQLRVLPSERDAEWVNEPSFTIHPVTNSANPHALKAGEQLEVKVKVENRSKRVDRFYLTCPELTNEWFDVRYPESSIEIPGLVRETDGLELNPGSTGEITLVLHPPQYTPAGKYFPTIRLISSNKEDLVLLDVVYLQLLPNETLNVEMRPLSRKVPEEPGEFEVELTNQGNIKRELIIRARDEEGIFSYTPEPLFVRMSPGDASRVALKAKPQKWWRRPFWGKGLELKFDVELQNSQPLLLPAPPKQPALPKDLPQGTLVWNSRPWWLLLLLILLALGAIGAIAFFIWLNYFPPAPPFPKVIRFDNAIDEVTNKKKIYQEGYGNAIRLDWEISHLSKLQKVTIIGLENNVETDRKTYFFDGKIPPHLERKNNQKNNFCEQPQRRDNTPSPANRNAWSNFLPWNWWRLVFPQPQQQSQPSSDVLFCKGIITSAKKPGNYTFKLQVFSKPNRKEPSDTQITDTITINPATPLPLPKIVDFSSAKATYQEVSVDSPQLSNISNSATQLPAPNLASARSTEAPVLLNWEITNPLHVKELRIIGLAPDGSINSELKRYSIKNSILPPELSRFCEPKEKLSLKKNLVCKNVPTDARQAGDYKFQLTVLTEGQQTPSELKETNVIKIQPLPLPQIADFSSAEAVYEEVGEGSGQSVSANAAAQTAGTPSSRPISGPIRLNWEIANPNQIKELKLVSLAPDGSVNSELKRYPMINNSVPPELASFCRLGTSLICRNVPTDAGKVGDYTFTLTVVPKQEGKPEVNKNTPTVKIQPQPPTPVNILSFKVNNQEVSQKPKYTYALSKQRGSVDIVLSWQVQEGEDIKVELSPSPGAVSAQGFINYTLGQPPSSETITLKVTNKAGEQKTQSVVIQTVEPVLPSQPQTSSSGAASPGTSSPGTSSPGTASPTPSSSDRLSPIELPPQAN